MPIRPIDVRRKEFKNSFRGYDANQVDDFLDAVADEFERSYTDNSRMREEISSLRERLQQFEDLEGSIRAALVHAEEAANDLRRTSTREAEDLRQSANREAEFTIREAKARSHQMLAESSARVERVQESYEALQEAKRGFANDFRHLLKTYMDMMENMEVVSAKEIEASLRERLDTESIAVAREAAVHEEPAPEYEAPGPQPADTPEEDQATEDDTATRRIEPVETTSEESQPEPELEEPEVEPSTASAETPAASQEPEVPPVAQDEPVAEEPAAEEEVEREEPTLAEEKGSESFFEGEERPESSAGEQRKNRIFRASRFLRRRE